MQSRCASIYGFSLHLDGTYGAKHVEITVNLLENLCLIARHQLNKPPPPHRENNLVL
jgi:hypothetical protein